MARANRWYLIAARDGEQRTYRVSRIGAAEILDVPCHRPEDFDLATYWEASSTRFREQLPHYDATFLAEPSVMAWIRWYRGSRVEEQPGDGDRVRVKVRFDAEHEAVMFALSFGTSVELVDPPHLRERVAAEASATFKRYEASPARAAPESAHRDL